MKILLTENSPIGMLHLASVKGVLTDFFPVGTYHDELYELEDYVKLCARQDYDNAIMVCNKSPWSDWIWSNPNPDLGLFLKIPPKQQDVYQLKGQIYALCGWKPDAIINIYDGTPDQKWRKRVTALSLMDPELPIISLNMSDPKFSKNIVETIQSLDTRETKGL